MNSTGRDDRVQGIHHAAIVTADVDASMRFWRDGLGFTELFDHTFTGDWKTLFAADTDQLRSIFLGDPANPDTGIVELVVLEGSEAGPAQPEGPAFGFFLLSLQRDVDATWRRWRAWDSTTGCGESTCQPPAESESTWPYSPRPTESASN